MKHETLDEILSAIHDLLYLLDFYTGYSWAIERVRHQTLELMKSEAAKKIKK